MMTMVIRGFFPEKDFDESKIKDVRDPGWQMILPLMLFTIAIIVFGVYSTPLTDFLGKVVNGVF